MTSSFAAPPWDEPLDVDAVLRKIPPGETIKGMFPAAVVAGASGKGVTLPGARERYVAFQDYPLREHAELLVAGASAIYPGKTIREGLRRLGRHAHATLVDSTIGRVLWAAVDDAPGALSAMTKAYAIAHPRSEVSVTAVGDRFAEVRLAHIGWFLDCHHVGCFEGALKAVGVEATIAIRTEGASAAAFRCSW